MTAEILASVVMVDADVVVIAHLTSFLNMDILRRPFHRFIEPWCYVSITSVLRGLPGGGDSTRLSSAPVVPTLHGFATRLGHRVMIGRKRVVSSTIRGHHLSRRIQSEVSSKHPASQHPT